MTEVTESIGPVRSLVGDKGLSIEQYRDGVLEIERNVLAHPMSMNQKEMDEVNPLKHIFTDGLYLREITMPEGQAIVSKIHKIKHPWFLMKGEMSITTPTGWLRLKAPSYGITEAGTKRIVVTHEECVFITLHVTKETDIEKIEKEVIAEDFDEVDEIKRAKG